LLHLAQCPVLTVPATLAGELTTDVTTGFVSADRTAVDYETPHLGAAGGDGAMALEDRDRRVLVEIARQVRADDPEFAAAMTGPSPRPRSVWAPIHLRVLAILLLAAGVLTSVAPLVLAGFVVYGIAQLYRTPDPHRSTTAGRDDQLPPSRRP
jgi:Protein of unknown function (DUF3040)